MPTTTTSNPSTASRGIPTSAFGLAAVSNYRSVPISAEVFNAAKAALEADRINGHRQAYLILYEATGNPAFSSNLAIATTSGQVGGVAWNANQQILQNYADKYPKDANGQLSIATFSWLVGRNNILLIGANRQPDGTYEVPDEHTLHEKADHLTWIQQDLAKVSPPGFLVTMDKTSANLTGGLESMQIPDSLRLALPGLTASNMALAAVLPIGEISAGISGLSHSETYGYITKAVGLTNTQTAVAGANDNGNTGKVWVGKNFDEVVNTARQQGGYSVSQVRDLTVVKDSNGVVQGVWTQASMMETTTQRVYQIMRGTNMSFAEATEAYYAQTGYARAEANARLEAGGMAAVVSPTGNVSVDFPNVAGGGRGSVNPPLAVIPVDRDSASYVSGSGSFANAVTVKAGGGVDDIWVVQKNAGNVFTREEFRAAILINNPEIKDINAVQIGQVIFVPQKQSNGSITYNYPSGATINTNAASGEYYMAVPNNAAEGGFTTYRRELDRDTGSGYIVTQTATNAAGDITFSTIGFQETQSAEIKSLSAFSLNAQGTYDAATAVNGSVVSFEATWS